MSATMLEVYDDFVLNLIYQCSLSVGFADLVAVLNDYRDEHAIVLALEMDQPVKNLALRLYTGCIVSTGTEINCYPSGLATTFCFDLDGNPV